MKSLRILISNKALTIRGGAELYVRDLACGLLRRGHMPVVCSSEKGEIADEIAGLGIPVITNSAEMDPAPDLIHGQDHLQTMIALLQFPDTPAVFFCHGREAWEASAPDFPRILQYVGVDLACRDRLVLESRIPESRVRVLLNFVDLHRFAARDPLPAKPKRALVLSNYVNEHNSLPAIRNACEQAELHLDVHGFSVGNPAAEPERIIGNLRYCFCKGARGAGIASGWNSRYTLRCHGNGTHGNQRPVGYFAPVEFWVSNADGTRHGSRSAAANLTV